MQRIAALACLAAATCQAQDTALTLYNQNVAVGRDRIELNLVVGENRAALSLFWCPFWRGPALHAPCRSGSIPGSFAVARVDKHLQLKIGKDLIKWVFR